MQVLTLAVLSIILTAPVGAILIALGGPRLLEKSPQTGDISNQHPIPEVKIVSPEGDETRGSQEKVAEAVLEAGVGAGDGPAETSSML